MNVGNSKEFTSVEWFAGGAGNHQGLSRVIPNLRCIAFCEREGYAVSNLVEKMEAGRLAPAPIWTDCRTFPIKPFLGRRLDLFIASYPCQGESVAGNQLGTEDPRFLWPYCRDFVAAVRPVLCFFENVRGHVNTSMVNVIRDLAELQYAVEPGIFSAEECGGSHSRERVFILARDQRMAHSASIGREAGQGIGRAKAAVVGEGERLQRVINQGGTVDNPARSRLAGGQCGQGGKVRHEARRQEPCRRCDGVDDTPSVRCGTRGTKPAREPGRFDAAESGGELADTGDKGLQRGGVGERAYPQGWKEPAGFAGQCGLPLSPPSPNDAEGWYRVLFSAPYLAPSLRRSEAERIFCRMADGMADESHLHELRTLFCENRVDRLRMLGNGVYPDSAALAFVVLLAKMMKTVKAA